MNKNWIRAIICAAFASIVLTVNANAQVVVFSNDFEDGNLDAEVGSMTLVTDSAVASVVPVADGGNDPILGNNVGLFDLGTIAFDLTLNLTDTLSLTGGNTVTIDFDVAARRTNGITRSIFVDALDSNGAIVTRFVLGESNIFGNGGFDRQRPGYATLADGNLLFVVGGPPGSFWWGADPTPVDFDPLRDAHITLTIGESTFDFSSEAAFAGPFSLGGLSNYSGGASANIAEIRLTSFESPDGTVVHGMYYDNIVVQGVVDNNNPMVILGDVDLDGFVAFADIPAFIAVLQAGTFQAEADCNEDGEVNFGDIPFFISILQNQ